MNDIILCDYKGSQLIYLASRDKLTFEGELKDIAEGILLEYGSKFTQEVTSIYLGGGIFIQGNILSQSLAFEGNHPTPGTRIVAPLFFDTLKQLYAEAHQRYVQLRAFW